MISNRSQFRDLGNPLPQLVEQRFMSQVVYVLHVVVSLILPLCLLLWLTRMDPLQYAELPVTREDG